MGMAAKRNRLSLPLLLLAASAAPAWAQDEEPEMVSQAVVQALPDQTGMTLNDALGRLARNPRDVQALIDAGTSALTMGDVDAATGFFKRAEQIAPGDARVKAGLACAYVRNGDPFSALPLFEQAEKAGALDPKLIADRGLAYDLVGDNAAAQAAYRQALARGPDEEASRRLGLSLAISGDRKGSDAALLPMLRQQDKAAWRARAFALAILGDAEQAVGITRTILPPELAASIAPYLRYMPRLTPAQQAAAVNFGQFPRASEIGRDDPRVAQYATTRRPALAAVDPRLTSAGQPAGRKGSSRSNRRSEQQRAAAARASEAATARVAPPDIAPAIVPAAESAARISPRIARAEPVAAPLVRRAAEPARPAAPATAPASVPGQAPVAQPSVTVAAAAPSAPPAVRPTAALLPSMSGPSMSGPSMSGPSMSGPVLPGQPTPGFDLASLAPGPSARKPEPASAPPATAAPPPAAPPPARPASLAEAFSEFSRPTTDATPAAGAVDLRRLAAAKPKPKPAARPAPPSHPSRIWVQVATGRDKAALGFDWRRMTRQAAAVLRNRQAFVSTWGQTNRLITGPFESEAAANAFMGQLRKAGIDGPFLWTSPAGQVVDPLTAR